MADWTDWGMVEDQASPTKHCLERRKDGRPRAKMTIVQPDLMQGWLAATGRISNFGKRDDEDHLAFFIRVAVILDRALAKEGAPAAWHTLMLDLEQEIAAAEAEDDPERLALKVKI